MKPKTLLLTAATLITSFAAIAEGVLRTREASPEEIGIAQATFSVGDSFSLAPFDDVVFTLNVSDALPGFAGRKAYAAHLGDGVRVATLSAGDNGAFDIEIRDIASARLYRLFCRDGLCTVEEIDLSHTGRGSCIEVEAPEIEIFEEEETPTTITKMSKKLLGAVPGNPFDDNVVAPAPVMVDIMLVFDNGARAWVENQSSYSGSITNFAIAQVEKMNSVLVNTGLHTNFWYRLVDVMTVDTTYTVVDNQILGIIKNGAESGDGPYGPIKERRAACGADLVSLMIDTGSAYGTTGIGYITHGTTYNTWLGYRAWCYSCCAIRSVDLEYTLSHEAGHNMGLAHSPTLAGWTKPGTFDYSNGYNFWGKDDNKPYHTIMAYDQDVNYTGYIEIPYFSSPDYTYQGTVIGTVLSNDCTRALRETCAAFANWRAATIPLPSDVTFSPSGSEAYRITLSTLGGYEIRYTTDGTEPTRDSTLYTEPLTLTSGSVTVKAIAVVDANTLGAVAAKTYSAAVELDEYVILKELWGYGWNMEYWYDHNGDEPSFYYWNTSSNKTAVVDASGVLTVNRNIDLGTLVANGTNSLEIIATDNALFATNLHVMGNTTLTGDKFSFENWNIHSDSTLTLSPGAGKTLELDKLNTSWYFSSAVLRIGEGTVRFKGPFDGGKGVFGNVQVVVGSGANLELNCAAATGYDMTSPFTVEKGGTVSFNGNMEHMRRPLVLNGGTINASSRFDRMYAAGITVNDDSVIEGNGYMLIRRANETITIAGGKTLNLDINTQDGANTEGWGLVKNGAGEMIATKELAHSGVTAVNAGTFTVAYSSSTKYGTGWSVASGATLKIEDGKFLEVPSLALNEGSILEMSASATAPIAVSNSVALVDVVLKLNGADDLSYGKEYPVMTASGAFTGVRRIDLSQMPALGDGFAWQLVVDGETLKARVATTEETESPVPLTSNNDSLVIDMPSDATRITGGGAMIKSRPVAIDSINTKVVSVTIDVEIPEGEQDGEKAICSWDLEGNIVRCIRKPSGLLDCYFGDTSQTNDRSTEDFTLVPGRHLISVVNRSANDTTYGGTYIYVDGTLAYRSAALRWGNNNLTRFTIGATAHDTPLYAYEGLSVYGATVLDLTTNDPLTGMTASGCSPSYGYFNGSYPTVFGLPPAGGFMMDATNLVAALDKSADSISVSVIASFPSSAKGTIFNIWTRPAGQNAYSTAQAEYSGDGTFFLRYNGNTNTNPFTRINDGDSSVDEPHLYTLTYSSENGVCFYQDDIEILHQDEVFKDSGNLALYRVNFGCGAWSDTNPNPMPDFKVYASHIALGTDDRTVSEDAVKESYPAYIQEESEEDLDPAPPATPATVDILVAYDKGAQAYVANKGVTLEEFAQEQIKKMNDVLVTNKLDRFYSYRLAGTCKVDATYSKVESVSGSLVSGAGPLVAMRSERELYGADTVTLLVNASNGATLGDSIPLSHSTDVASRHDCAFSVCSISAVDTGTQHTMIHENAHNMGCGHARQQSAINSPFEYGRGYYFMDGTTKRHTIMAYDVDGTGVYAHPSPYFSTTSKEFGFALGDSTNNNARVLKETCSEVAKWRESVVPGEDDVRAFDENGNEILSDCFFNGSLKVTVEAPVEGAELYYTFDGSEPVVDDEAWHQTSPFTFNFTVNRTLKIAYKSGETLSPVRTIRFTKTDNVPTNGLWQTCLKYPWTVEGDTIRSFNQIDYTYQCTTPLKATVSGPKRLTFSHKSYFGGVALGGDNYSHFDVLLDDSPVLAQTECMNDWTAAAIDIPAGTHDVVFVFSQRYAMNNPSDNKDFTREADDAVWLKDIVLEDIQMLECEHSSTSDDVSWVFPSSFEANAIVGHLGGIEVGSKGVVETLNFSTNAVVLSILAELPENGEGALMGLVDVRDSSKHPIYAYDNGDGTIMIYYDSKEKTVSSVKFEKLDVTGLHVWTLAYCHDAGAKLYLDGVEVASDAGIKWTGNNVHKLAECLTFGSAYTNAYPLTGMKIYSVHTDFGVGSAIFERIDDSADQTLQQLGVLADFAGQNVANQLAALNLYRETGAINPEVADSSVLRISEIMPKPTDSHAEDGTEKMDVNGLESGWVEVENTSDQWADLKDYRFIRVNRGKKTDPAGVGNFPSRLVPPRGRAIFYTSERYSNSKDKTVSAFAEGTFDGKPMVMGNDLHNILVWGDKVNPKKLPYVRLYYAPGGDSDKGTVVDTVVVPSDLPEGWSIIVGNAKESEGTRRWMCPTPTRGTANTKTDGLTRIGPNVGPLYEKKGQKKTDFANEFAVPTPPAVPGTDYTVTLPINGVMNPDGSFTPRAADQIQSIKFVYRKDLDDTTLVTTNIDMTTKTTVENWGDQYTATIPASYFPAAGHLMQWKVLITDGEGVEWTSPSFNNPDDGYEWYGTIVEPDTATQMSATLPTWHMFASGNHLTQMDVDASKQDRSLVPNQARVAIYDSSTSNYYDYVRIDLRGNTSKNFTKKSHGLRFAKSHPLTMTDVVTGETIEGIRKTSLISEFADPSYMRQMIAFWLWRKMGNLVPFDFPVRCNLNGEFYQLAFNSERFTDELIEDVYGLDKFGYSYKNVGTMSAKGTTAGGIEKKTPDDENENDLSVLNDGLITPLNDNSTDLDKFVVEKFNLPAWLNYLASARITQEMDDVWANVCAYYDNPDMLGGVRGKDTWMPLGYDFNLTFGQYYINDLDSNALAGLSATNDWYKSHPLYGGWTIRARKSPSGSSMNGNNGFEAIYQSAKFRRLYLRRLRTLMDQELKEPGTPEGDTPFMSKMREMANLMRADATLDLDKWKDDTTDNAIDVWKNTTRPADMDAGIDDIWDNYVVPRREHLYVTHSVTNTAKEIGYGSNLNAGIPEAQSPIATLAPNISISNLTALDAEQAEALGVAGQFYGTEVVIIQNDNAEAVDMSGWRLAYSVDFTFPAGTVCDANDAIYIVADRRAYIDAHEAELTDQVIVGNATFTGAGPIALYAADGTLVYSAIPHTNELKYLRLHSFYGNTLDGGDAGEWFTLTNISDAVTLDLADVTVCFLKQGDDHDTTGHCHVTLTNKKGKGDVKPLKSWTAQQLDYSDKGWLKIQNNKQQITIYDKYGSVCQSLMVEQKKFPLAYGNGGYLVCDSTDASVTKNSQWHAALYELANDGELSEPFSAEDQEVANELVATAKPVLSEEDIAAGLNEQFLQYLTIVAEPVEGSSGQYKAVVVVNPETVEVPVVGVDESASAEPVEIEDDEGGKTVSVSITNAIIGLWYGYEVSDALGEAADFANDVDSFERATGSAHKVKGSLRDKSKTSGFFRLKVLPAKPSKTSE